MAFSGHGIQALHLEQKEPSFLNHIQEEPGMGLSVYLNQEGNEQKAAEERGLSGCCSVNI